MTPTEFYSKLTPRDREMMTALQLHEQSIHKCGLPVQIGMDPNSPLTLEDDKCFACAMLEEKHKESANDEPGTSWRVAVMDRV